MCVRVQHTTISAVALRSLSAADTVADSLISDWLIQHSDDVLTSVHKCACGTFPAVTSCLFLSSSSQSLSSVFQAWIVPVFSRAFISTKQTTQWELACSPCACTGFCQVFWNLSHIWKIRMPFQLDVCEVDKGHGVLYD